MTSSLTDRIENALAGKTDVTLHYVTPTAARQPITAAELDAIERSIDARLPTVIRDFYLGVRELGLAWSEGAGGARMDGHLEWNTLADESFWRRAGATSDTRGAMINIPPADVVFRKGYWLDRIVPEPQGEELELDGRRLSDELYNDLYPFDFVSDYYVVALWYDRANRTWRAVLGGDHGASWTDYRTLDVAEYMAQLERGLGGPRAWVRQGSDVVRTIWSVEPAPKRPQSDGAHPEHPGFPLSVQPREINEACAPFCRALAESMPALTADELAAAVRRHEEFVARGELGGGWECTGLGHFPVNIYRGLDDEKFPAFERIAGLQPEVDALEQTWDSARAARVMGAFRDAEVVLLDQGQLSLAGRRLLQGASLAGADLRAANLAGSICEGVELRNAKLAGSNAVDGFFDGASFAGANLDGVDFSRSSMRGCDFRGASLAGTDFQNVDLTGANFSRTDTTVARFPGALLDGVVR